MADREITVVGAGIVGLWQALTLAKAGHRVRLADANSDPFSSNASRLAGAMLAPDCEAESAPEDVRVFGREGLAIWRETYPGLVSNGSLVVAGARDRAELTRFARLTANYAALREDSIKELEADLGERFSDALYFADEAHMTVPDALQYLLQAAKDAGTEVTFGQSWINQETGNFIVDCRGLAARDTLSTLRGVRGERVLVRSRDIQLRRPVRLLHPRHPLYIVPWTEGRFLIGATMIESEDAGPMTVRSALELLGAAYALHPAFAEAEILDISAGVRPAFPDNVPRAIVHSGVKRISVNGAYRHGFLLAPVLARAVASFLADGSEHPLAVRR